MSGFVNRAANLTLNKLLQIEDQFKRILPTKHPLCIIKFGPPGSGKSSADSYIQKMFGIDLSNFTQIDKDNPLISIQEFREGSIALYEGVRHSELDTAIQEFQDKILNEPNREGLSINDKMPIALQRAFDLQLNVLWETTAQSARSQNLMERVFTGIPAVYKIIILYPIVSEETSLARVKLRALSHLKQQPPYYRPVPADRVRVARVEAQRYFKESIIPRVLDGSIYQLFCYNNEEQPGLPPVTRIAPRDIARTRRRVARGWRFEPTKRRQRQTAKATHVARG
jgi:hypothetical protein